MEPTVSFITTVKNGQAFIESWANSILSQDLSYWECIVVDDGSNDETPLMLKMLAEKDNRFRVLIAGVVGRGKALNLAVSSSRAELICNLDIDDVAHPSRARFSSLIMGSNPQYDVISGSSELFFLSEGNYSEWKLIPSQYEIFEVTQRLAFGNPLSHSSVVMRRSTLLKLGGYDESRVSQLDYDMWVRMVKAGYRIANCQVILSAKRIHAKQSFEHKNHLIYVLRDAEVKWRAIGYTKASYIKGCFAILFFLLWGVLPRKTRFNLRNLLKKK